MLPSITEIVKNNVAKFSFYRNQQAFYVVTVDDKSYQFPVSLEDVGGATLLAQEKAIILMRYIRRSIEDGTFVRVFHRG